MACLLTAVSGFCETSAQSLRIVNDAAQGPLAKSQALDTLKKTRDFEQDEIAKIDKDLRAKISETSSFQVQVSNRAEERANENKWSNYSESLRLFSAKREETLLKEKLLDRLMFEIDSKWNGQNMRSFLEHTFLDLSLSEMTDDSPDIDRALFYSYMSVAVREIPEKTEDLISFLIGYMNFSTVTKPKPPLAYINTRNYSNGSKSMSARATKSETISQLVEKRLKVVEEMRSSSAKLDKSADGQRQNEKDQEDFDDSKLIKPRESEKSKPSASATIINFAPERVSEVLLKD